MSDAESSRPTVQCRECGMEILAEARVCGYCESYQAHWRNELRYFANIAGVFTVIGTAIFFSITLAPTLREALFWEDRMEVVKLDGNQLTIANAGDGNVFVYEVVLEGPGGSRSYTMDDTLGAGTVLHVENAWGEFYHALDSDEQFLLWQFSDLGPGVARSVLLSAEDPDWERAVAEASWESMHWLNGSQDLACFGVVPVSRGGNYWNRAARLLAAEPSSIPIPGRIRAFSLDKGRVFESEFTVEGLLLSVVSRTVEGELHPDTDEPVEAGLLACEMF